MDKPELNFKPLSEGLGFHPFSDGLPYAPLSKTPSGNPNSAPKSMPAPSMGTGAVSAGPPRVAMPSVSVPVARPAIPSVQKAPVAAPVVTPAQAPAPAPASALAVTETYGFAYLFKRLMAYALDSLLNLSLCLTALSAVLLQQDLAPEALFTPGVLLVAALFALFFNWALITAQEVAFGTTIGKRIFGLSLQGSASALFLRAFFFLPSAGFCGIGLLWALFNRRRRCWHDMVVDVQPLETAQL